MVHIDAAGTVLRANRRCAELVGCEPDDMVGRNLVEFGRDDPERFAEMLGFGSGLHGVLLGPVATRYQHADGTVRETSIWATNHLETPGVEAFVCVVLPPESRSGLTTALASIAEGAPVETTLGHLATSILGNPFNAVACWLLREGTHRRLVGDELLTDAVRATLREPGPWWDAIGGRELTTAPTGCGDERQQMLAAAGVPLWWVQPLPQSPTGDSDTGLIVLRAEPGAVSPNQVEHLEQIVSLAGIAIERSAMQHRLAHAAYHDPLTGLTNRSGFFDRSSAGLAAGTALLYLDLDHFKPVNDALGHAAGDVVLVTVAERIRRAIRPDDRIARLGGDEFVIQCDGVADDDAIAVADRIISAVQEPVRLDTTEVTVGVSVGIARTGRDTPVDDLLDRSDTALLDAKTAGRGRWHLADEHDGDAERRRPPTVRRRETADGR